MMVRGRVEDNEVREFALLDAADLSRPSKGCGGIERGGGDGLGDSEAHAEGGEREYHRHRFGW